MQQATEKIMISHHALDRARVRLGYEQHVMEKLAVLAYNNGKRIAECEDELKNYLSNKRVKKPKKTIVKVYGGCVFVFRNHFLVTVYRLPERFKKI